MWSQFHNPIFGYTFFTLFLAFLTWPTSGCKFVALIIIVPFVMIHIRINFLPFVLQFLYVYIDIQINFSEFNSLCFCNVDFKMSPNNFAPLDCIVRMHKRQNVQRQIKPYYNDKHQFSFHVICLDYPMLAFSIRKCNFSNNSIILLCSRMHLHIPLCHTKVFSI